MRGLFQHHQSRDWFTVGSEEGNLFLLKRCLETLFLGSDPSSNSAQRAPFYAYAAEFWPMHLDRLRQIQPESQPSLDTLNQLWLLFNPRNPDYFLTWIRTHDPLHPDAGAQPDKVCDF